MPVNDVEMKWNKICLHHLKLSNYVLENKNAEILNRY